MDKRTVDERLARLGMPDDFAEVALDGVPALSPQALERIESRTFEKAAADPTSSKAQSIVVMEERKVRHVKIAAASLLVAGVAGIATLFGLTSSPAPVPGNQPGQVVQNPVPTPPVLGKGGGYDVDLPPVTGNVERDADAYLRKFYALLNEKDFETAGGVLFHPSVSVSAEDVDIKGVGSYTLKSSEFISTEPDQKAPGDTILMKIVVDVQSGGPIESPIYQAGENTLYVQMGKGSDGSWRIEHFRTPDGKVWPHESSGCTVPADKVPPTPPGEKPVIPKELCQ